MLISKVERVPYYNVVLQASSNFKVETYFYSHTLIGDVFLLLHYTLPTICF